MASLWIEQVEYLLVVYLKAGCTKRVGSGGVPRGRSRMSGPREVGSQASGRELGIQRQALEKGKRIRDRPLGEFRHLIE